MIKSSIILFLFSTIHLYAQNDLDKCVNLLKRSETMILRQDSLINLLKKDILLCDSESELNKKQNQNCEISLKYINKELNKEKQLKKLWQVVGISGVAACVTTTILYIVK